MIERILERAKKAADAAEVYYAENEATSVTFEAGKLNRADVKNSVRVILRCIVDGRIGYASATSAENADELIENAMATAAYGKTARFEFSGGAPCPDVKTFDAHVAALPVETMVESGEAAVARLLEAEPTLNITAEIKKTVGRRRIINSAGMDRSEDATGYLYILSFTRAREGDIFEHWGYDASASLDVDEEGIIDRLLDVLRWADVTVPVKTGKTDLIVYFAETPAVLRPLLIGLNGENVARGSSPLVGKLGEKTLDERLTVYDDPTIDFANSSACFDGEGTAKRKLPLVEEGAPRSYLLDMSSAAELGLEPTGNANRGGSAPTPGTSNVVVSGGDKTYDELIGEIDDGIIALTLTGAGMGNVLGGEISASIWTGLKVENGEIVGRAKNTIFSGNVYEMLKDRIKAISSDVRTVESYVVPAVVIADQLITGTE
ncbi:MAG: TldD/PmbA family protein [Candidatus Coatesbacteria bacterium]|nr:MAG: TldD/PmbA family protein [Candidatus Coatesbacteria bacterium]